MLKLIAKPPLGMLPGLLLLLALALPPGPGAAAEESRQEVGKAIERLVAGETARIGGTQVDTAALAPFYAPGGYRPLWLGTDGGRRRARQLLGALSEAAYHGLRPADYGAAAIEGRHANHSKVYLSNGVKRPEFEDATDPSKSPGVRHPMVRTHPASGKKCLYLGRRLNSYIFDLPVEESEELLDRVWAHTCRDKYVWEHKWAVGDLLVWDNRCTMHHRNAFPPDARRLMHKSITAGEPVV